MFAVANEIQKSLFIGGGRVFGTNSKETGRGDPGSATMWGTRSERRRSDVHDIVIRGGRVVDGSGTAAVTADVAID
ncbi:MAG: hypothetical protein ACRD6W_03055, partial [Nitrososphaerales archaeon]